MNLLTQEQGARLKVGDKVNVIWFTPRKPKGEEVASRQWEGRTEWMESVWRGEEVAKDAWLSTHDGYAVTLKGRSQIWLASHMELDSTK